MKFAKIKLLKMTMIVVAFVAVFMVCLSIFSVSQVYNAYALSEENNMANSIAEGDSNEVSPYALTAALSLTINGGDGKVWATVKNDFTLYPGKVSVIVQLYCSDTYAESYTEMTLVSANSISDLNMGKTIVTEAGTGGVEKFWLARMRYKIETNSWMAKQTAACRLSANGDFLGYI